VTADIPDPPFAHIPGRTPRPREDHFDALKSDPATALRAGLAYFERAYYWECHELMEPVWMAAPDPSAERDMAQAIIQLANARLKLRMERPRAALRLCAIVSDLLGRLPPGARPLGQDPAAWRISLAETEAAARR
jgi:predicted metal-dependent hydrolase